MDNESTLSREGLDDRIAMLRDNIRQLTEQAAASSGAADEARNADRIAAQDAELQQLIRQRDDMDARKVQIARAAGVKAATARKAMKKKVAKTAVAKKKAGKPVAKKKVTKKTAKKVAGRKAAKKSPAKKKPSNKKVAKKRGKK